MSHVELGQQSVFSMNEYVALWSGVEMNFVEQARRMMALWVVQSSWAGG